MSCKCETKSYNQYSQGGLFGGRSCCCSLPTLIILILIILQFSKHNNKYDDDYDDDYEDEHEDEECKKGHKGIIDNGILFIIALFYLSCCGAGCGREGYGGGCGAY